MILDDLLAKLQTLDTNVFYGLATEDLSDWNYTVFNRVNMSSNQNKISYSDYYNVAVVRENFITEDLELRYIEAVSTLAGFRLAGDVTFSYVRKPNTSTVIEIMTIPFVRAKKKVIASG